MKNMKKSISLIIIVLLVLLLSTNVFAASVSTEKATLEIVENNICTINVTDQCVFNKSIINSDLENKEITIGLTVSNNATAPLDKPSEIVLLVDNSASMNETISTGGSRMQAVSNSAKLLASELLKLDTVKLSVVSFSSANTDNQRVGDPDWVNEATLADAKLRCTLTNVESDVLAAIEEISSDKKGARTNIDAGLQIAGQQFTGTCESQFIILLSDGVPNLHVGTTNVGKYNAVDITATKDTLLRTNANGIRIISMMTGISDGVVSLFNTVDPSNTTDCTTVSYKNIAESIFGTPSTPTVGKFYYITDDEIEETISSTILEELKAPEDDILTGIDIVDFIPKEIVENYEFISIGNPSKGSVFGSGSQITWHIDKLSYGETASYAYKLKLKDSIDESIVDVITKTNTKVNITCEKLLDENGDLKLLSSDISPKIRVVIPPEPTPTPTPTPDVTVIPEPLPQTGILITTSLLFGGSLIAGISVAAVSYFKNKNLK